MDSFIFKGINSTSFNQIVINSLPPISKPPKRTNKMQIDGKDGDIIEFLGYEAYEKEIQITILENTNIDDLIEWLNGSGKLVLSNEPDKYYKAEIINQIDFPRLVKYEKIKVKFHCQPFKYKRDDLFATVGTSVINEGNIESKPIIRIEKETNSSIEITINGVRFKYTFDTNDTYVEIDCEEMTALYEGLNRNRNLEIGFEFPKLSPGINNITVHNGDAVIKIKRKDRWL